MNFNFITNLQSCSDLINGYVPVKLVLYSHIPSTIVALIIGIFVLIKNKTLLGKILFAIISFFSIWVLSSLVDWLSTNSIYTMATWSLFWITEGMIAVLSFYFFYVFLLKKDLVFKKKILLFVPVIPLIILTPTTLNLMYFDLISCEAKQSFFDNYPYILGGLAILGIMLLVVMNWKKIVSSFKKEALLMFIGLELFLLAFFSLGFIASYYDNYEIEFYGLFGMTIFMAFLAYLIVKFKEFNIKLISSQALVLASVILIGSQFFYLNDSSLSVKVLTTITLIISGALGLILVRSVKKEIALREQLEVANAGQTNLIHIMNHQIKGYLGINKNIFAELLTDDYGQMPEEAKPLITKGFDQSEAGVEYVTQILRGESAENGRLSYDMKPMNFKDLVSEVVSKQKEIAEKKSLTLDLNSQDGVYDIIGDHDELREAIRNLIDNSIHYTFNGGISVSLKNQAGKISLIVKDTGIGIKESDKPRLFKSGGTGKDSIKVNVQSSGYGLVFSKGVIEAHKGKIWFESDGEGKGTTFFVELPIK